MNSDASSNTASCPALGGKTLSKENLCCHGSSSPIRFWLNEQKVRIFFGDEKRTKMLNSTQLETFGTKDKIISQRFSYKFEFIFIFWHYTRRCVIPHIIA
mmetsp:Transcript_31075/g.47129  ORF Transcript_31075/g.47129 Transcript_31075/m.47129 type:complete len:100 (-) Transcript_31075:1324-1623(-)